MNLTGSFRTVVLTISGILLSTGVLCAQSEDVAEPSATFFTQVSDFLGDHNTDVHGFVEFRPGYRFKNDPYEKDMSIMESRLQLDLSTFTDWADIRVKADTYADMVTEQGHFDLREANAFFRPLDFMDAKLGRQILTWGTGDLLFINDMFPKDWQSFFIGRDTEYLKAPSDAAKFSFFTELANIDVIFTPKFDHDRFINGERISYYNTTLGRHAGNDAIVHTDKPNQCFRDSELAVRVYKNINNYELALYGYHGFWKSPAGMTTDGRLATFPDLNVYGSSIRGALGKGIFNAEVGYYQSTDNESGDNPFAKPSEFRYLVGYTQDIARDFTASVQYYVESIINHGSYLNTLPPTVKARDQHRHLITLRLTKLLMNQNLRVGLFTYFSPTDKDSYLRPNVNYKVSDNLTLEAGSNIFLGDYPHTFFGQFHNNSNIYSAVRYSF